MYSVLAASINHPDAYHRYRGIFNYRMLRSLKRQDVELDVVSPRPYAPPIGPYSSYSRLPLIEDWGDYEIHHPRFWYLLPKRLLYTVSGKSYARRVPRYVEQTFDEPDVVQACHIYPDGYGMLPYVREKDLPLFVVSHGTFLNSFESQPPGVGAKIRETLNEATGVICVSDALARKATRLTDPSKVVTVPIGADPERFPVDHEPRLRRELGIAPETTVVLFVGKFIERKGIDDITELLPELDMENTIFVFIGHQGEKEQAVREALARSSFPSQHLYTGMETIALRRWFAVADLLVLPSYAEGRPTVIYEAMASETAVLASEVGGIPEQVADGETGVLISPGDTGGLRANLDSLTNAPEWLQRLGEAGRRRLEENNWTWADHSARVRDLHLNAINRQHSTPVPTD